MTEATSPILLFDSGVGGLTVLGELRRLLPDAHVIYAADYAGLPYGTKTEAQVAARVAGLLGRMSERYRPRLACIACNTASTIALGMVRDVLEIPIVGTVPAIKPAALASKSGVIGLLGTEATVRQPYVDNLEAEFVNGGKLLRHAASALVDEAERKLLGHEVNREVLKQAIDGLESQDRGILLDHIVLGCTHFPLLREELMDVAVFDLGLSPDLRLIDGSEGIARRIVELTQGQPFERNGPDRAVTTGDLEQFRKLATVFSNYGIDQIERF